MRPQESMRRITFLFLTVSLVCLVADHGTWGARRGPAPERVAQVVEADTGAVSNVWVVVNLFGGATSKQAEKVRETLMGLGAGGRGIIMPYGAVTVEAMERLRPAFLALSPNGVPWCRYKGKSGESLERFLEALRVIVEQMDVPVVGICGGHQALALAFGGKVGPIRGGEDDCLPYGKNPPEHGRRDVAVRANDPIFLGAGKTLNLVEDHYEEVKRVPAGFVWLAGNSLSPYQIIRHPTKPAYGIQAHTEYYMQHKPDGGTLLRNFLRIAKTHNATVRAGAAQTPYSRPGADEGRGAEAATPW